MPAMPTVPSRADIPSIADPTERLRAAGTRLLLDEPFRVLAAGLSPERVTRLGGRSRRTFYDRHETKEDFLRWLLRSWLTPEHSNFFVADAEDGFLDTVVDGGGDFADTVAVLVRRYFTANDESETTPIQFLAHLCGDDPAVAEALSSFHETVETTVAALLEASLEIWALQLREPWTPTLLARSLTALADAAALRNRDRRRPMDVEEFTDIVLTLFSAVLQRSDEPREDIRTAIRRLDRTASIGLSERRDPAAAVTARRRVLDALVTELEHRSVAAITLADVADTAGVGLGTVRTIFPDVLAVLRAVIDDRLPPLERALEFDRSTMDLDTRALVLRHLQRTRRWTIDNRAAARGVVEAGYQGMATTPEVWLRVSRPLRRILRIAIEAGEIRPDVDLLHISVLLTHSTIGGALVPEANADIGWLVDLLFDGIGTGQRP